MWLLLLCAAVAGALTLSLLREPLAASVGGRAVAAGAVPMPGEISPTPAAAATANATALKTAEASPLVTLAPSESALVTATVVTAAVPRTMAPTPTATGVPAQTARPSSNPTPGAGITTAAWLQASRSTRGPAWPARSIDTMKLSRDTLTSQLSDAQIDAVIRLDAMLHLSYVTVDVYYDDPAYMARWVQAIRAEHLQVWFRAHWYAWETHHEAHGDMTPTDYINATRDFLQHHIDLVHNGDIFDFCPEPENGAYWNDTYGSGWSWRNKAAKTEFNTFIRSGVYMASTTLANRGRSDVLVTAISVDESIATRLVSKPTAERLGMITLDLYPEGTTTDPATATSRLLSEIDGVHKHWNLPILIGEHGYSRDRLVSDTTQAKVLAAEFAALERLPYIVGLNYWVDAGGPQYGGYTNLYTLSKGTWKPRAAAAVLAGAYRVMSQPVAR